jgi:hypothetical protein
MIQELLYQLAPIGYALFVISAFICGGIVRGGLKGLVDKNE